MKNTYSSVLLIVTALIACGSAPAHAQPISRDNPFRSYNLSGVNYGSQQWERDHKRQQASPSQPITQQRISNPRPRRVRRR